MASSQSFLVGTIPVTTFITSTTIAPTFSQTPPQSPSSTTASSSPSKTPSPPKKKAKRVVLNPQPISMIPSPKAKKAKTVVYPLQKDNEFKTVFAPADIPKDKHFSVKVTPADIKISSNNFRAADSIPEESEGYNPIFNFLWNSPIAAALSISTSCYYHHLLQEFWWTATYDDATKCIEGTVLRGSKDISIDADVIRKVLKLDYLKRDEKFVKPASTEEWQEMLKDCGYNFNIKDEAERVISKTPLKARLPGVYHYVLANIIQCIGGNSGSYNQANQFNMQIMHGLVTGRKVDFAAIIFADMVNKVTHSPRVTTVPFSRFFSLVIRDQLGKELYHQEGYASQKPAKMNQQVFKLKSNGHIAQLSIHIRKTLCKLFPSLYPSDESLLVAQNSEDATVSHQVPRLPTRDALLIKPSARPSSPIHTQKARTKTTKSQPADVKKHQLGFPKGSLSVSKSPTPKDIIGTQANPPAVSKKTAGEKKRIQQAASPKTSVGRGSEEKGSTQPARVVSKQKPIALSSLPPVSAPLKEPVMSQAGSEAAILFPSDSADQTLSADEGPQPSTTLAPTLLLQDYSSSSKSSSADGDEESAESLGNLDFGFLLGSGESSKQQSQLEEFPSFVQREFTLRDETSSDEIEEVFAAHTLPEIDTTLPPSNSPTPPIISSISIAPVSIFTPSIISTQPISSAAFVVADADVKPVIKPKWVTLKDLMIHVDRLTKAMEVNCSSVVGLVDSQHQCHQAVLDTNACTSAEYTNIIAGINGLMELFKQLADLHQQFASTIKDEVKPAQLLVSSRFDRVSTQQAVLRDSFVDFKSTVKASIAGLQENMQEAKLDRSSINELIGLIGALERSSTTLIAKVELQFGEMDQIKSAVIDNDNTVKELLQTINAQTIHLGKLTTAVNNVMDVAREDMFSRSDRLKLDKVADDVSSILSILRAQQQSFVPPAVSIIPTPAVVSNVEVVKLDTTSKGEKSPPAEVSQELKASAVVMSGQQVASPASTKGEQITDLDSNFAVNVDEEDFPITAEELVRQRKGKMIIPSSAAPASPKRSSDKLVKLVAQQQRRDLAEKATKFAKVKEGEGSTNLDPFQLAADIGLEVSEVEAAARQAHEDEATKALLEKEAHQALMDADDEIREEALNQNLSAEQSQVLLMQAFEKKKRERAARKKLDLDSLRAKYNLLVQNRLAREKITSVTATATDQGKIITIFIKRKGVGAVHTIADLRDSDLGVTEWVEVYLAVAQKSTTVYIKLIERMSRYFDQIRKMEEILDITDSVLNMDLPSSKLIKPKVSKKRKTAEPHHPSHNLDVFLRSDGLINTNLPAGVPSGNHGDVIRHPEHGMFFETFQRGKRFYRISDLNITSSELLLAMYNCCSSTSNDVHFISLLLEEINKRRHEPIIKKFRNEN